MWPLYIFLALVIVLIIIVISNVKVVPQAYAFVIERFGAYSATWSTGLHVKVPFVDRISKKVSLKEQVIDFRDHKGQCDHSDRHRRLFPDHGPEALCLRRGAPDCRH